MGDLMYKLLLGLVMAALTAPVAWAQNSYTIRSGDVLQMEVVEDPSMNRSLLVLPDGSVSVPTVGTVRAAGQSVDSVRSAIQGALSPNFAAAPTVYLAVGQVAPARATGGATIPVYVMGEVANPGKIRVAKGTSLLQFLAESGGLTRFAATKRIQVQRTDRKTGEVKVYGFDYKAVQNGGSAKNIILSSGDVIVVPERRLFE
ncbi:MAG TPA: polysaccharide biosynthesis/export family protein [Albidovulum sp.]|uniref:polysaccharide biosynthesis/export family protein n=2 Tax=Albidovulum sp. TaxID=1872424 RepID=UPI002D065989|nr:polysaccharide biosynthesis/export family protein [Paracoccaceae bacterium]HPE25416.1 polysaccharide biosynthesis/export family protein [Albidovulum sp.]HRV62601.1 polysaccharide biosynthesis/export family protein [Albidovulum sp.]